MQIKTILSSAVIGATLLVGVVSNVSADTCPGTKEGVFTYNGTLPTGWENSTQEAMKNGDFNFTMVTWKPNEGSNGTVYCTYTNNLVLASDKKTAVASPSGAKNWEASQSVANSFHCMKGVSDCEFTVAKPADSTASSSSSTSADASSDADSSSDADANAD